MSGDPGKTQQGVQSVEVGMRLAECLAYASAPLTLKELAAACDMPAAKAHRYLVSLIRAGVVERHPVTGKYDLGQLALEMGLAALGRLDLVELGGQALLRLRDSLDETLLLAVWGNRGPTVVRWLESSHPVTVNVRLGSVMPLLSSATGRTFLAYLPAAATQAMVAQEMAQPDTPYRDRADVEDIMEAVRAHGLGRVHGDLLPGVAALAAPAFNQQGEPAAVLTALGAASAFDDSWDGPIAEAVREAARALSARLGYRDRA